MRAESIARNWPKEVPTQAVDFVQARGEDNTSPLRGILIKLEAVTAPSGSSTWVQIDGTSRLNRVAGGNEGEKGRLTCGNRSAVSYLLRRTVIRFKHVLRDGQLGRFYAVHAAAKLINGYMEKSHKRALEKDERVEINGAQCKQMQRIAEDFLKKTYPVKPEWGWHTNGESQHDMQEKRRGKTNGDNTAWSNCKWLNTRWTAVARKHSKRPYEWS
ncbi:hypothetical protein B0H14DRAFT_2579272 [Mycena olivaceomarginata]|nr:hypothetical protein B0H14DRAFT_2579272 [Mycena olivaceomarginata]